MAVANDDEWDDETYARQQEGNGSGKSRRTKGDRKEHLENFYEEVFLELAKFGEAKGQGVKQYTKSPLKMGADVTHRGQLNAWLRKKKSGASAFRMREYNKRYFTLDFDTHTFFYAHSEGSKKVSAVTPFADIVDVRLPEADKVMDKGDNISEVSKTSKRSFLRRTSSFLTASKDAEEQHLLMVMTRPAKTFELLCSSATEAVTWFEALKMAIAMDRSDVAEAHTTAPSEEEKPKGGGYPISPGAGAVFSPCSQSCHELDDLQYFDPLTA
eukprot:symbB.v1.2.006225.t1/scaffold340.1/size245066/11